MKGFTVSEAAQRSPEWVLVRLGRLTGSRARDMRARRPEREAVSRWKLRKQLVQERLTGLLAVNGYENAAMRRGVDLEPAAIRAYEAQTGCVVRRTGFLADDELMIGCSVDGDVDDFEGIVEVKCQAVWTHIDALIGGRVPATHLPQITHNLWVSGASWCDFVSFDDRFGSPMRIAIRRVNRCDVDIVNYAGAARVFLAEVTRDYLAALGGKAAA